MRRYATNEIILFLLYLVFITSNADNHLKQKKVTENCRYEKKLIKICAKAVNLII